MNRSEAGRRCSAQGKLLLACWVALSGFAAVATAAPIKVWSINFNDSAEPGRWHFHELSRDSDPRLGSPSEQVQWALVPRNASQPSREKVLQFSATSKLSVETYFSIFRPFPPEFQPDPSSDLVLEWEWMISETELSGAVSLIILREARDGTEPDECYSLSGHTKFTGGWAALFDPSNRWVHHRLTVPSDLCPQDPHRPKHRVGIIVNFGSPVRQTLKLASLRVEEWPHGELPADALFLPHRPPPLDLPFEELPFDRLRRSTAGAAEDLDGDGLPELLVLERRGYAHLYRHAGRDSELEEITEYAGLAQPTLGTGAMFLDLDADGDRDLVLTSEFDVPRFFENLGDLRFRERRLLDDQHLSFWYGVSAEDVDRDGDLDLLFVSPLERCFLFLRNHNRWNFKVEPLFDPRGLARHRELNFSASFADIDDDGWPDFFLGREYLFRNSFGRFALETEPWKAMDHAQTEGGLWADLTGDGRLDLLILRDTTESTKGPTRLFQGGAGGAFTEITSRSGLPPLESAEVALAEDFDNDGDLDLYLCQRDRPNYLLLNDGRGRFDEATESSGFSQIGGCDAALAADMNGDGGLDIIILRYGSSPIILSNQLARGQWLGVILEGKPGTQAIGARVRVLDAGSGKQVMTRWVRRGQGFGSVGPSELRFGLGTRQLGDIEVRFPSGRKRLLKSVHAGSTRLVSESYGGVPSAIRQWLRETRFPFVRSYRRILPTSRPLAWLISGLACIGGLLLFSKPLRVLSILGLAGGALIAVLLGSIPGRGLAGSLPALWVLGGSIGILIPTGAIGLRRLARTLRKRSEEPAMVRREDLIRFTLDFRHAGIENRALLSIHGRVQNLFLAGELHSAFLSDLRRLAAGYPETTGARLRTLLSLSGSVFPGLFESARLEDSKRSLDDLLGQLALLGGEPSSLRSWQNQLLLTLQATEAALDALLKRIDLLCSCDLREALHEACAAHIDGLQRAGITLQFEDEGEGPLGVLITRESLLLILDNLFTNALTILETTEDPRIVIQLRQSKREVCLRFSDNGLGVSPELSERIFQYGFSTRPEGKGYGLARSREILGHFGGSLILEPSPAKGTTFLLTFRIVSEN